VWVRVVVPTGTVDLILRTVHGADNVPTGTVDLILRAHVAGFTSVGGLIVGPYLHL
jgi:hypothetical protein